MTLAVETYPTLREAAQALGDRARYLGGGTLLMRAVNYGDQSFDRIVRSREVDRTVRSEGQGIRIGAGATMADVLASRDLIALHSVARIVGGPAVRNMATVGGNLFAASPYGDFATALLALDATVQMADGQNLPMESFLSGRARMRGIVASVTVPRVGEGEFRFAKVSRIKPKGVSMMSLAAVLPGVGSGRLGDVRIAFGTMGPTPLRAKAAEQALRGRGLTDAEIEPALKVCCDGLQPADDELATEWYRREVAPVHLKRLLLGGRR
ncbi:FAD binding domain-containing protein [Oceaniglobus trochenteri]|uniref:FAD binding domain-containing protein n=1 Tax=Oceaniglobus trochenteri TaxID=2763260 RepID=UPI001D000B1C|nr:FAD binding domain-containing protein [Oceaniglobus trochenteri]